MLLEGGNLLIFSTKEVKSSAVKTEHKQLSVAMWTAVVKRQMLLYLKAKYAGKWALSYVIPCVTFIECYPKALRIIIDGQKVAKRISRQIEKEGTIVKQLMEQYNQCAALSSDQEQLTQVLDPISQFWCSHSSHNLQNYECGPVPLAAKQDVIRFCLQKERSVEESQLLMVEILNTRSTSG